MQRLEKMMLEAKQSHSDYREVSVAAEPASQAPVVPEEKEALGK